MSLILLLGLFLNYYFIESISLNKIDLENFRQTVITPMNSNMQLTYFHTTTVDDSSDLYKQLTKLSDVLEGIVPFYVLERATVPLLRELKIEGNLPAVVLHIKKNGEYQSYVLKKAITANNVIQFMSESVTTLISTRLGKKPTKEKKSSNTKWVPGKVLELNDNDFSTVLKELNKPSLVMFHAPWCGYCVKAAPMVLKIAEELGDRGAMIKVDATKNTMLSSRFQIKGYPTYKYLGPGKSDPSDAREYIDGVDPGAVSNYFQINNPVEIVVEELSDDHTFNDKCNKGVCVVAFLPNEQERKKKLVNEMTKSVKGITNSSLKIFWTDGVQNQRVTEKLDMTFGLPAMAAFNIDKSMYAIHRGSFGEKSLRSFYNDLSHGRATVMPLPAARPPFSTISDEL